LALTAFLRDAKTAWAAGIFAAALNVLVLVWFFVFEQTPLLLLQWNALYYSVMVLAFTWVNAPLGKFWSGREVPYRMTAAALVSTVLLVPLLVSMVRNLEFRALVLNQMETLGAIAPSADSSGLTAEELLESVVYMGIRGGILLSCLLFWWINRQFAFFISRFIRREQQSRAAAVLGFRTPFFLVWVLSCSLAAILLGKVAAIELPEIAGWNILALSATLFLVQGGAVALHFLAKLPPMFRIFVNIGIVLLILRPGINAAVLGSLVLLGIAENWVPFREPKKGNNP
jgi:hypothetical protein